MFGACSGKQEKYFKVEFWGGAMMSKSIAGLFVFKIPDDQFYLQKRTIVASILQQNNTDNPFL